MVEQYQTLFIVSIICFAMAIVLRFGTALMRRKRKNLADNYEQSARIFDKTDELEKSLGVAKPPARVGVPLFGGGVPNPGPAPASVSFAFYEGKTEQGKFWAGKAEETRKRIPDYFGTNALSMGLMSISIVLALVAVYHHPNQKEFDTGIVTDSIITFVSMFMVLKFGIQKNDKQKPCVLFLMNFAFFVLALIWVRLFSTYGIKMLSSLKK